jgi:hypothetical protein
MARVVVHRGAVGPMLYGSDFSCACGMRGRRDKKAAKRALKVNLFTLGRRQINENQCAAETRS